MFYLKLTGLSAAVILLAGCATHEDTAYLSHQSSQPMVVPQGVQAPMQKPLYAIPKVAVSGKAGKVSLLPPGSKIAQYRQSKS